MGKSCPGALTEGTQHRGGKGVGQSTDRVVNAMDELVDFGTKRKWLSQVGAWAERFGVNGELTPTSAESQGLLCFPMTSRRPVRGCPEEAVDVHSYRTKVKRRKASVVGKVAHGIEPRFPLVQPA